MDSINIFSLNNFIIKNDENTYHINKNCYVTVNSNLNNLIILNKNNKLKINLKNLELTNNSYRLFEYNNSKFLQIISCGFNNLQQKYTSPNFEVLIYDDAILIINKTICYAYYYNSSSESYFFEYENYIYVFNNLNLLMFNSQTKTFTLLNTLKIAIENDNYEVLCQLPKLSDYLILYTFNKKNNSLTIKKLKEKTNKNIPIVYNFFYQAKFNIQQAKLLLKNEDLFNNCNKYFNEYDDIIEINEKYYLFNYNKITPINFLIKDNLIDDID